MSVDQSRTMRLAGWCFDACAEAIEQGDHERAGRLQSAGAYLNNAITLLRNLEEDEKVNSDIQPMELVELKAMNGRYIRIIKSFTECPACKGIESYLHSCYPCEAEEAVRDA